MWVAQAHRRQGTLRVLGLDTVHCLSAHCENAMTVDPNLCAGFQNASRLVWTLLRRGRDCDYQIAEQTVTDSLLVRVKESHKRVILRRISQRQEASLGADWEWWFVGRSGRRTGVRVQAKVLKFATRKFESLYYPTDATKPSQVDTLLKAALLAPTPSCSSLPSILQLAASVHPFRVAVHIRPEVRPALRVQYRVGANSTGSSRH